ncbi:MAG TPA: hypothetical protein VF586_08985 [Pyrinomonadaceae bacterium]
MQRTVAPTLLLLACGLALAGCRWSYSGPKSGGGGAGSGGGGFVVGGAEGADALVKALNSFTGEMLGKIESARETKDGVAEAQALLNASTSELAGRIAALKRGAPGDAAAKAKLLEAEVDNTDRVHRLQLTYADAAARDPDLKARLERLISDYDALFR